MKVLHLVGGSLGGGAARAAIEIHDGLVQAGVDSSLMHSHGRSTGEQMIALEATASRKLLRFARTTLDRGLSRKLSKNGDGRAFSAAQFGMPVGKGAAAADILHLHWINDGGFRLPRIGAISKPVIWTLHDMWPVTGGCHYTFDCRGFEHGNGCRNCPATGGNSASQYLLRQKTRVAQRNRFRAVAVSEWLAGQARKSSVFNDREVISIPNLVDTEDFWPVPKKIARASLGLHPDRPVLLTGHASSSYQKGGDLIAKAVMELRRLDVDFDLVGFGNRDGAIEDAFSQHFGFVHDVPTLRLLYSAADVFAFPSRIEAFGRTIIEAFACGTPVVAFSGSAPDEILINGETGFLASGGDTVEFASCIARLLEISDEMAEACRNHAVDSYSKPVVTKRYLDLYETILASGEKTMLRAT